MPQLKTINPTTRISGFMEIDIMLEERLVTDARIKGEMFRGFELMLRGRNPFDAVFFSQRICGICSSAHSLASSLALEQALGYAAGEQGRYLRDIIHACEFLQNHIRHFYQYKVPDFVLLPKVNAMFETDHSDFRLPRRENDLIAEHYFESLEISRNAHQMLAVFGGKAPHNHGVFVGGVIPPAGREEIALMRRLLQGIRSFICDKMLPDAFTIAENYSDYFSLGQGYGNLLSYGCFNNYPALGTLYVDALEYRNSPPLGPGPPDDQLIDSRIRPLDAALITESIHSAWYNAEAETYTPTQIIARPDRARPDAYSWIKAPRYQGLPYESGPLARMWLSGDYRRGISAMDRTLARVLEAKKISDIMLILLDQIKPGVCNQQVYTLPQSSTGAGLIDTTRGALGHWLKIEDQVLSFYQIITPSAWNLSSRTADDMPGVAEQALINTYVADSERPAELARIVRTFDPCVSCATHVYDRGKLRRSIQVLP